jgi:excinuclease ABC subunit C
MLSRTGELIYIGKAKCLRSRLLSYFRTKSREAKAGHILGQAKNIVWEYSPCEFGALLRELELIRRWRPRFNVQGQQGRRRPTYVCLGRRPAPYAFLIWQPPAGAVAAFGPVPGGPQAREAVRVLNNYFRLRDCPQSQEMVFADQAELFPMERAAGCLRYEIGTCLGPCLGACSRAEYREQVRAARAFLAGTDLGLLQTLERDMAEASAALAFERAAALRDKLNSLRWLHERLDRLRLASRRSSFVYPVEGYGGRDLWYLIQGGRAVASVPVPRAREENQAAARLIASVFRPKSDSPQTGPASEMDSVFLIAAWFRRHPQEQARILQPEAALALFAPPGYLTAAEHG